MHFFMIICSKKWQTKIPSHTLPCCQVVADLLSSKVVFIKKVPTYFPWCSSLSVTALTEEETAAMAVLVVLWPFMCLLCTTTTTTSMTMALDNFQNLVTMCFLHIRIIFVFFFSFAIFLRDASILLLFLSATAVLRLE